MSRDEADTLLSVAQAARISMSIPGVFFSQRHARAESAMPDYVAVSDGGLADNLPYYLFTPVGGTALR